MDEMRSILLCKEIRAARVFAPSTIRRQDDGENRLSCDHQGATFLLIEWDRNWSEVTRSNDTMCMCDHVYLCSLLTWCLLTHWRDKSAADASLSLFSLFFFLSAPAFEVAVKATPFTSASCFGRLDTSFHCARRLNSWEWGNKFLQPLC